MDLIHTTNPMTGRPCGGTFQEMTRHRSVRYYWDAHYRTKTMAEHYYVCDRCGIGCDVLVEDQGDRERAKKAKARV